MANIGRFFVTVAPELIDSLLFCPPQHWAPGSNPTLSTFSPVPSENMMPAKLKIRGREKPVAGEIYRALISREERTKFVDARTGKECTSRDGYMVRLYVHDGKPPLRVDGELRFATFPIGSMMFIVPSPVFTCAFTGIREQGCFWVAALDIDYRIIREEQKDVVLFTGPVVVQVAGEERRKQGSVAIDIGDNLTVYDRREDRLSSFARAEHIRRTVGKRTFEFVNLRDFSAGEAVENPPEYALTKDGFESIE